MIADIPLDGNVADPIVTVNLSPASSVAFELAIADSVAPSARASSFPTITTPVTPAAASTANAQVMGIIASITGISFTGQKLNELVLVDLTDPASVAAASPQSIAISSFGAAVIGGIDGTNDSIAAVIASIVASITVNGDGNVLISGNDIADIADQVAIVLGSPALAGVTAAQQALQTAKQNSAFFRVAGIEKVTISQAEESTDTSSGLSLTKTFIAKLVNIINGITATTGSGGIGITGGGATEVFADALFAVDNLSSVEATRAFNLLEDALIAAEADLAPGETFSFTTPEPAAAHLTDALTGSVTKSADGLSLTLDTVAITVTNIQTGVAVEIAIPTGERTTLGEVSTTEATAVFAADGVTVTTTTTVTPEPAQGEDTATPVTTTIQTFTGSVNATFLDEGVGLDLGLKTLDFDGSITTAEAPGTFTVALGLTDIEGTSVQVPDNDDGTSNNPDVTGKYSASFGFGGLTANFAGDIRSNFQTYAVTFSDGTAAGTDTVMGSVSRVIATVDGVEVVTDTNIMTDGAATLTLEFTFVDGQAGQLTGPTVTEAGSEAPAGELTSGSSTGVDGDGNEISINNIFGTVDELGVVRYSDGSVQSLPAAIN